MHQHMKLRVTKLVGCTVLFCFSRRGLSGELPRLFPLKFFVCLFMLSRLKIREDHQSDEPVIEPLSEILNNASQVHKKLIN